MTSASDAKRMELRDVHFSFARAERAALDGVSLTLSQGEVVGVLGPNGSGKSTLMRLMAGLIAPTRGEVFLYGRGLGEWSRNDVAKRVAFVPQRDESALDATVMQTVLFGRAPRLVPFGVESAQDHAVARAALAECGASELALRRFSSLSGGEQKRVTMARALAQEANILLLDEPAAFLDIHHQIALLDVVKKYVSESGYACMLVVHDLNLAAQYCDRLVLLDRGRVVAQGPVDEVMTYRRIRDAFRVDVYVGVNELSGARYFVPMRGSSRDENK